jgi:hypothetical protein
LLFLELGKYLYFIASFDFLAKANVSILVTGQDPEIYIKEFAYFELKNS